MECGCIVKQNYSFLAPEDFYQEIKFCPLHEAAERMLEALKYVQDNIENPDTAGQDPDRRDNAIRTVRYAIAKAEGA